MGNKKWQAYYIAPLQPPTLATFRSWGSSAGAGRVRPASANIVKLSFATATNFIGVINMHYYKYPNNIKTCGFEKVYRQSLYRQT